MGIPGVLVGMMAIKMFFLKNFPEPQYPVRLHGQMTGPEKPFNHDIHLVLRKQKAPIFFIRKKRKRIFKAIRV